MILLPPQLKILLALEPLDFRKGIESMAAVCRLKFQQDPYSGTLFVFRNRAGNSLKMLVYDSTGFYLIVKRFSQCRLKWWPCSPQPLSSLAAKELYILLYNGIPVEAQFATEWRRLP